jgi:hypothetical protein
MELKDIIRICFSQGKTFYTHTALDKLIKSRYGYLYGKYINARLIRSMGIRDVSRTIGGVTVRGFWLDIKDYTLDDLKKILEPDRSHPVYSLDPALVMKKIRFLMRDWDLLPPHVKIEYRKNREEYLKEIVTGCTHNTEWFYKILKDLPSLHYEGKDIDFVLKPAKEIIHHLHSIGVIKKAKTPGLDKMHFLLTEHGFVRINDYVYGKLIVSKSGKGLPDW